MDCIRTITTNDDAANFARKFKAETGKYGFNNKPSRLQVGDFMFFAHHGQVKAFAEILQEPRASKSSWCKWYVKVSKFVPIRDYGFYRGYAGIRYLDKLGTQYNCEYEELVRELQSVSEAYREGKLVANKPPVSRKPSMNQIKRRQSVKP